MGSKIDSTGVHELKRKLLLKSTKTHVLIVRSGWKKVSRLRHTEYFILGAGLFAIGCGILAIVDAARRGEKNDFPLPFAGTPWPQVFPLVLFGVVTALAWTTSQKAVLRVASIEVTKILTKGVQLGDIADMWELKPNLRWLKWRRRMWKSSLVALLCFMLYISAALMYRLAFTIAPGVIHSDLAGKNNLLFGCRVVDQKYSPPDAFLDAVTWFGYDAWKDTLQTMGESDFSLTSGLAAPAKFSENGWYIHSGWRGFGDAYLNQSPGLPLSGQLETAYLVFVQQKAPVREVTQSSAGNFSTTLEVQNHPTCGSQLVYCSRLSVWPPSQTSCIWIGLAAGTYRTNFTTSQEEDSSAAYAGPKRPLNLYLSTGDYHHAIWDGHSPYLSPPNNQSSCPIPLSSSTKSQIIDDLSDSVGQGLSKNVPAVIAARFSQNVNGLNDTSILQNLGLIPQDKGTRCDVPDQTGANYSGQMWNYFDKVFFPVYQYTAGILIVIWGCILVTIAMPWRHAVLDGSLYMWMRLGADLPSQYLATDKRKLVIRKLGDRMGQVGLEDDAGEATHKEGVAVRTRLEYGWKYTYL
jgi:hypothetical protein